MVAEMMASMLGALSVPVRPMDELNGDIFGG